MGVIRFAARQSRPHVASIIMKFKDSRPYLALELHDLRNTPEVFSSKVAVWKNMNTILLDDDGMPHQTSGKYRRDKWELINTAIFVYAMVQNAIHFHHRTSHRTSASRMRTCRVYVWPSGILRMGSQLTWRFRGRIRSVHTKSRRRRGLVLACSWPWRCGPSPCHEVHYIHSLKPFGVLTRTRTDSDAQSGRARALQCVCVSLFLRIPSIW